jgi:hypothetical protein
MINNSKRTKSINLTLKSDKDISVIYPNLATPCKYNLKDNSFTVLDIRPNSLEDGYKYTATLLIDKESKSANEIMKAVKEIWKIWDLKNEENPNNPIKDGDKKASKLENEDKNGDVYKNKYVLRTSTKKVPKVFTKTGTWNGIRKIDDEAIHGYFCNVMICVSYYKAGTNVGVTCYLTGLQLIEENPDLQYQNPESEFDFDAKEPEKSKDVDSFDFDEDDGKKVDVKNISNEVDDDEDPFM